MINAEEFAQQNNFSVMDVIKMIQNGDVYGKQIDGTWHVDPQRSPRNSTEFVKESDGSVNEQNYVPSLVVVILNLLAVLTFLGGVLFSIALWPGDAGEGYGWKPIAYTTSLISFSAGFLQFVLFVAIAKIITYLGKIEFNTRKKGK